MSETVTAPPRATEAEAIALNEVGVLCELIDGRIVRKTMGRSQAYLATRLGYYLNVYLAGHDIGHLCGPDLLIRFSPGLLLQPDLTFTNWDRCPGRTIPDESVADIMPNLAVEVLSPSNRPGEMSRKLVAYFGGGVELVWIVDPQARSAVAYSSPTSLSESDTLRGGAVLPGFELPLATLFAQLA